VLGILSWLGKIRICTFQDRVLIAVPKLFLQANVTLALVIFGFHGAFGNILIRFPFNHESTSSKIYWLRGNLCEPPLKTKVYLSRFWIKIVLSDGLPGKEGICQEFFLSC
jgi:hypothetical protein